MFEVNNGVAKIDGAKGMYDEKNVTNSSERYGRNAVQNYYSYMEQPLVKDNTIPAPILDFCGTADAQEKNINKIEEFTKENDKYLSSLPPLNFEYRYMPNLHKRGEIDKQALFGASFENMGQRDKISVDELNSTFALSKNHTFKPVDINNDGFVDNSEYSTTMLAADMFSKSEKTNFENIDGTINSRGLKKIMEYTKISNAEAAKSLYSEIYNKFNLGIDKK